VEMGKLVLAGANPPEASPIHEHDHDHPHPHSHGSAKHKPRKQ
jgi:hypothetical protein